MSLLSTPSTQLRLENSFVKTTRCCLSSRVQLASFSTRELSGSHLYTQRKWTPPCSVLQSRLRRFRFYSYMDEILGEEDEDDEELIIQDAEDEEEAFFEEDDEEEEVFEDDEEEEDEELITAAEDSEEMEESEIPEQQPVEAVDPATTEDPVEEETEMLVGCPEGFALNCLWLDQCIAISVDQVFSKNQRSPLTTYYVWPETEAWDDLLQVLTENSWISESDRVCLLNRATEVINYWQDEETKHSLEEAQTTFPDCVFMGA